MLACVLATHFVPSETNLGAALATENLNTSKEAVIAAAAAEAVTLAKEALKVAKDAALMVSHGNLSKSDSKEMEVPSDANTLMFESTQPYQVAERVSINREPKVDEIGLGKDHSFEYPFTESDDVEAADEELVLLQEQHFANINVIQSLIFSISNNLLTI